MGGSYKWPSLADVLEYRRQVKEVVINVIENAPLDFPITPQSPWVNHSLSRTPVQCPCG